MFALNTAYSTCADPVEVNPFTGVVSVDFLKGGPYRFTHVSRREIVKALAVDLFTGGLPSVGQWINRVVL